MRDDLLCRLADPYACGALQAFTTDRLGIVDGVLRVGDAWYRIEAGVLDLLPAAFADAERRRMFASRYGLPVDIGIPAATSTDHGQKAGQIAFFKGDAASYDHVVSDRSLYVASDLRDRSPHEAAP
jgi:hypothetical protein